MKKTMVALLTLIMVLLLFPASAFAGSDGQHKGWTRIADEAALTAFMEKGGKGYLAADIKVSEYLLMMEQDVTAKLDLNGHVIEGSGDYASLIFVYPDCTLTILDSRPLAKHSGDYASLPKGGTVFFERVCEADENPEYPAVLRSWGKMTINGGNYIGSSTGGDAVNDGDSVQALVNGGDMTINGGYFKTSATTAMAMTIAQCGSGSLTINGGSFYCISDTYAECLYAGTSDTDPSTQIITIRGGRFRATAKEGNAGTLISYAGKWKISGCDAIATGKAYASALYLTGENSDVTVTGGKFKAVSTGDAAETYGIMNDGGKVTALGGTFRAIGEGAKGISQGGTMTLGGSLKVFSTDENLYLPEGKTVTVKNPGKMQKLSVVLESGTGDITAPGCKNYARYFTSADSQYRIKNTGKGSAQVVQVIAGGSKRPSIHNCCGSLKKAARMAKFFQSRFCDMLP